ncbi:ketopantoate reductase family protein [Paenibacillus sinopodophylli]|uniref:ketopantoate reductase family protein n=1 Tax=Paenibacillus sinopodophylli TaxID=1837342 RepID=UPI0014869B99|nr:2-dehydropantoate 2-reductase [Paenibacillus sinopodophylli]
MQIDVIGGGSLGLLFGAKLADAGGVVTIWTRSSEQAALLTEKGVTLRELGEGGERSVAVLGASALEAERSHSILPRRSERGTRWIIVAVKQTDVNEQLLSLLQKLATSRGRDGTAIVCLQNGIGHLERIMERLPSIPLYAVTVTEGAKRLDGHTVEHTGKGELWIGEWTANGRKRDIFEDKSLEILVSILESAGFATFLSNNWDNRMYNKLLINAVINPLTAIFDVENGQLPLHPSREQFMRALHAETEQVLIQAGMLPQQDSWQTIIDVCRNTSRNVSSMLSDIRGRRATEIDAINGGVVMLARKLGQRAPLNEAVIALVKTLHPKPNMEE